MRLSTDTLAARKTEVDASRAALDRVECHVEREIIITFEGEYVKVIANGFKDLDFATELWTGVVEVCRENNCLNVLGLSNTTRPLRTMEAYKHADLFRELGVDHNFRIAWVELNPEAVETIHFVETVLVNRGFTANVFEDELQARNWLLAGDER